MNLAIWSFSDTLSSLFSINPFSSKAKQCNGSVFRLLSDGIDRTLVSAGIHAYIGQKIYGTVRLSYCWSKEQKAEVSGSGL